MPGSFVRCDSFQQGLGIGADGGQRTFQVPVLDALHPLQQDVQRFLDVGEQGAGQVQIGEGHRRQQSQRAQPGGKEHPGDDNGHHQHDEIGAPEPFLNGHKTSLPVFCSDCTKDPGRMVKQSLKRADTLLIKSTKIRSKNWMQILKGDSHKRIKL